MNKKKRVPITNDEEIILTLRREKTKALFKTAISGLMWNEVKKNKHLPKFLKIEIIDGIQDIESLEIEEEKK